MGGESKKEGNGMSSLVIEDNYNFHEVAFILT